MQSHWRLIDDKRKRANQDPSVTDKADMLLSLLTSGVALTDPLAWAEMLGAFSPWSRRLLLLCVLLGGGSATVGATLLVQLTSSAVAS